MKVKIQLEIEFYGKKKQFSIVVGYIFKQLSTFFWSFVAQIRKSTKQAKLWLNKKDKLPESQLQMSESWYTYVCISCQVCIEDKNL